MWKETLVLFFGYLVYKYIYYKKKVVTIFCEGFEKQSLDNISSEYVQKLKTSDHIKIIKSYENIKKPYINDTSVFDFFTDNAEIKAVAKKLKNVNIDDIIDNNPKVMILAELESCNEFLFLEIFKEDNKIYQSECFYTFAFLETVIKYYDNGQMIERYSRLNGELHGLYEGWYNNGILSNSCEYINGKREGESKLFYPSGQLYSKCKYINGCIHGLNEIFYENGNIKERQYYDMDNLDGPAEYWYNSGHLKYRCNYNNNELHGIYEEWDELGLKIREKYFEYDKLK